jgi:Fe2+ or Zn2+ uptake regulation protein
MTGGNPRTMIMFIRLLVDNAHAQGFEYLKDIIDQTTAIYQERLQQLTPQQRKIIVELASIWQPATVEQLVQTCLMPSSLISAQLNKLQKSRIVEAIKPTKGKTVYRLRERMFNLYLIMTQAGAMQKKRARYLTDFLEVWYDERDSNLIVNFQGSDIAQESPEFYASNRDGLEDQIFILYLANKKEVAKNLIQKYKLDNTKSLLKNIFDLWLGNLEEYQKQREILSNELIMSKKTDVYFKESLVHYQYDWIIQLFDENETLKQQFEVMYFAALLLQDPKLDVNILVPKSMLEAMQDVLRYVKERQAFYYGGKQNN